MTSGEHDPSGGEPRRRAPRYEIDGVGYEFYINAPNSPLDDPVVRPDDPETLKRYWMQRGLQNEAVLAGLIITPAGAPAVTEHGQPMDGHTAMYAREQPGVARTLLMASVGADRWIDGFGFALQVNPNEGFSPRLGEIHVPMAARAILLMAAEQNGCSLPETYLAGRPTFPDSPPDMQ